MRLLPVFFLFLPALVSAQVIEDDFEGNGNISSWYGDDCAINTAYANPYPQGVNPSSTVLRYHDTGGQYANIGFNAGRKLDLSVHHLFSLKIFVPSAGLSGNQNNQVSLKLQDASLAMPWSTQSEVIKNIVLDQWQTLTFDFANDAYHNLDPNSAPPTQRKDFDRILIQVNGENNNDAVLAYIDDFYHYDSLVPAPVFDQLVWADEFNGSGAIDSNKWFHQTQLPNGSSWYNNEIQHYTNRIVNSYQSGGSLHLVARKENFSDQGVTKQYTSARLNSKFAFQYGRIEIRAKLPTGVGTWPAIWMLGQNIDEPGAYWEQKGYGNTPWPACGEIDIMEHWGSNQNYVSSATHTPSSFGGTVNVGGQNIATASSAFHLYALEWTADKLVFSVDSVVHFVYHPTVKDAQSWPFDDPQYLLLNIAIEPGIDPNFTESDMEIDYLRIYQQSGIGSTGYQPTHSPRFFPNPVNDRLQIDLGKLKQDQLKLKIHNSRGQLMGCYQSAIQGGITTLEHLGHLPAGLYILSYELEHQSHFLHFLKS